MKFIRTLLVIAAILLGSIPAHAQLTQENSTFGSNTVILDSATGSRWLSLSITLGESWNSVNSQLATTFSGYRIATLDEISQFAIDAGVTINDVMNPGVDPALHSFMQMWGTYGIYDGFPGDNANFTFAVTNSPNSHFPNLYTAAFFYEGHQSDGTKVWSTAIGSGNIIDPSDVREYQSIALVSSVPEPETYAMLLAGLGLVGAVARRRHSDKAMVDQS